MANKKAARKYKVYESQTLLELFKFSAVNIQLSATTKKAPGKNKVYESQTLLELFKYSAFSPKKRNNKIY